MNVWRKLGSLAAAGAVGALVGLVIAGGGSRIAMGLIARADDREDFGSITDSGAVVGEITTGGTIDVLEVGVAAGLLGAVIYLALRRWLPERTLHSEITFSLIVLGFGLLLTVEANRGDFVILDTTVSIVSFAAVIVMYALVLPLLIERVTPRTPRRSRAGQAIVLSLAGLSVIAGAFALQRASDLADQDVQLTSLGIVVRYQSSTRDSHSIASATWNSSTLPARERAR